MPRSPVQTRPVVAVAMLAAGVSSIAAAVLLAHVVALVVGSVTPGVGVWVELGVTSGVACAAGSWCRPAGGES